MYKTKKSIHSKKNKILAAAAIFIGAIYVILIAWMIWSNTAPTVNKITLSSERLPKSFSGYRIAQVSDLHNAKFGDKNEKLLDMLSKSSPDIITITGDLVDSRRTDLDVALDFAEKAAKIAPTYYVSGNHEARIENYDKLKEGLLSAGVTVLEDEAVALEKDGEALLLIGLDDPDFSAKGDSFEEVSSMISTKLKEALSDSKIKYSILLSHRPEFFDVYVSCGIDLVLSGHTHGGQFRLPFIGGLYAPGQGFFPKYDAGMYSKETTSMAVSRGLGNSVIPLRINNRPELVLIELNAKEAA